MKTLLTFIFGAVLFTAPKNTEVTPIEVPMCVEYNKYEIHTVDTKSVYNQSYNASPIRTSTKNVNAYGGASSIPGGLYTSKNNEQRMQSASGVSSFAPSQPSRTCQYCNGTGYINDYGDGELTYGKWYFQNNSRYGDGTSCTDETGYHDECDTESQGQIYHHFAKRTCPYCNGTGKNPGRASGWTSWEGYAWSHAFGDSDHDGHCDEHYWHAPIGDGAAFLFIMVLAYFLFLIIKHDAKLDVEQDKL